MPFLARAPHAALALVACTATAPTPGPAREEPTTTTTTTAAAVDPLAAAILEAHARSVRRGKPPLAFHRVDVTLRNPATGPRWLLLPTAFEATATPTALVHEIQTYALSRSPRVLIVKAVAANFWAVRLPGAGSLTLRGLGIDSRWAEIPAATDLTVIVARELTLAGRPLEATLGLELESASGAEVDAPQGAGDPRALEFWRAADPGGAALVIDEELRATIRLPLARPL